LTAVITLDVVEIELGSSSGTSFSAGRLGSPVNVGLSHTGLRQEPDDRMGAEEEAPMVY